MRRGLLVLAMLLGVAMFQSVSAPSADAHHHWGGGGWGHHWGGGGGWGWGHNRWYGGYGGWGHRNWGFGRGYVYRPYYRPYYGGYGGLYRPYFGNYGGYGGYSNYGGYGNGYGGYGYPIYNNYYPSVNYGYYPNYGYTNGYYNGCQINYQPSTSQPVYETQLVPGTQPGQDMNLVIAQVANVLRERRANNPDGRLLAGKVFDGNGIGNGKLKGVVQNIVGGVVQNQQLSQVQLPNGYTANTNVSNVRFSNPDARSKARTYLTQGDNLFHDQRYAAAAQQYRAAASMAPDLAEANWRYAHTLVAMGEYDLAVNAVDRALAANSDTIRSGFNLDTLYGNVGTAKASHLEGLANAALQNDSPNAYFLLGMTLHYSGEGQRAEKFFVRAADLQGRDVAHIAAFVSPAPKAIAPAAHEPPPMLARLPARET